jgi:hypothetical protein
VTGAFTANGDSAIFLPRQRLGLPSLQGRYNFSLWGAFVASVTLQRSFDQGVNWIAVSEDAAGTPATYTGPITVVVNEPEFGVQHRAHCVWTSGTVNYRISQ